MAAGDTIGGTVRIVLEDTQGNRNVVVGNRPQSSIDYTNNDVSPDEKQYINTQRSSLVTAPAGAQKRSAPDAVFEAGEKLIIQHKSSSGSNRSIDVDFDSFNVEGVIRDLNRANSYGDTLGQSDQELTANPDEDDSSFVDFYQYTVPDRTRFFIAGELEAVAIEA